MNYRDWIIRDPKIMDGRPIIKGTQVTLKTVLGHLALGDSMDNILQTYPEMSPAGLRAVIAFAASLADLELKDTISPATNSKQVKKVNDSLAGGLGDEFVMPGLEGVYAHQGYLEAAKLYREILKRDPKNAQAKKKLDEVEKKLKNEN